MFTKFFRERLSSRLNHLVDCNDRKCNHDLYDIVSLEQEISSDVNSIESKTSSTHEDNFEAFIGGVDEFEEQDDNDDDENDDLASLKQKIEKISNFYFFF